MPSSYTVVASDDFNRADETPLSGGGNWIKQATTLQFNLSSNAIIASSLNTSDCTAVYVGRLWKRDHSSKAIISSTSGGVLQGYGLTVRGDPLSYTGYHVYLGNSGSNNVTVGRTINGSFTQISQFTQAWSDGATWELLASGPIDNVTLQLFLNDSLIHTDSGISSAVPDGGYPGVIMSSDVSAGSIDNWQGLESPSTSDDAPIGTLGRGAGW